MFKTLDEVIEMMSIKYQQYHAPIYNLPTPGYTPQEIANLELRLRRKLHSSFTDVLAKTKLDEIDLCGVAFGSNYLEQLVIYNNPDNPNPVFPDTVLIATSEIYSLEMNNQTGEIYASSDERRSGLFERIALNTEQLICRLARLCEDQLEAVVIPYDSDVLTRFHIADSHLLQYAITNGPYFLAEEGEFEPVADITPGPYHLSQHGEPIDIQGNGSFFWREFLLRGV